MKTTTLRSTNSTNRSPFQLALLLIPLALACFALAPQARATCQEGCLTNYNTSLGEEALLSNTTGFDNTASGAFTLVSNTTGSYNTAIGESALYSNTTGNSNTAIGALALPSSNGSYNTAIGTSALSRNRGGVNNTATGYNALGSNTSGSQNTANGQSALNQNNHGMQNTAMGYNSLFSNTTGTTNVGVGNNSLFGNTTGSGNTALGAGAGSALTTGSNNIEIGNSGLTAEANTIRIGTTGTQTNAYIAGISGATVPTGVAVIVDADGHLGTITSSARFKEAVKPMDETSEAILALKPVTFHYKHELDPKGIPQFGLVAEDVEKVNPALVARDEQGKPYTVRYEAVNAMLLNEFLKEHQTVQELKSAALKQEAMIARQQKQIEALTAGLQKVSAQLELNKSATRTVLNN